MIERRLNGPLIRHDSSLLWLPPMRNATSAILPGQRLNGSKHSQSHESMRNLLNMKALCVMRTVCLSRSMIRALFQSHVHDKFGGFQLLARRTLTFGLFGMTQWNLNGMLSLFNVSRRT